MNYRENEHALYTFPSSYFSLFSSSSFLLLLLLLLLPTFSTRLQASRPLFNALCTLYPLQVWTSALVPLRRGEEEETPQSDWLIDVNVVHSRMGLPFSWDDIAPGGAEGGGGGGANTF